MAEENPILSTDCSILSVSSEYYPTLSTYRTFCESDESLLFSIDPNTIVINKNTNVNLCLNSRPRTGALWAVLKFYLNNNKCELENPGNFVKRCVMVLLDERIDKDIIVMSEDLLYNLYNSLGIKPPDWVMRADKPQVAIENTTKNNILNASKVILSLFQSETNLENSLVDKMLQSYFSTPRFLCSGDVFSVPVERSLLLSETKVDKIYFKIVELQDIGATRLEMAGVCSAYCVNNSATIYQVPNNQDFSPPRRIAFNYKPNIYSLLCDKKLMKRLRKCNHNLLPPSFDEIFHTCCSWMDPFVCKSKRTQDIELNPLFLISGQNGTGKTLIVHALSQYFGMNYKRVDCVNVGGTVPGQAEAKLKSMFNQLKSIAPCILQLSNIEALCQDADFKEDVRLISCFEHQVKNLKSKWPIIIFATTNSRECVSSSMNQLFLDTTTLSAPNYLQREEILSWLVSCDNETIDAKILQTVSAQTSGFLFRDLQVLVAHALKEKYKRCKGENMDCTEFVMTDFSKIIGTMHKAYSESIGAPKVPSVSWKDVGGLEPLKKEILRSLRSNAFNSGLKRSGLLLHGPPGTGKTLLAKAVATQCGRNFLSVKGPELLNMYVGQSEHNVRDLFELAKAASPCIVFFDELDSLAPNRGRSGDSGGVMDRVVSQLLAEMDDLADSGDVFILGATNRPDLIDPALLRPGRLDKLLYVGPCEDRNSQLSVLTALTHKLHLEPDVDLQEVVSQLPASVSGAQLSALCSAAWLTSARQSIQSDQYKGKSTVAVNLNHFISAIGTIFNNQ